ncbi:hypothetical protein BCY86_08860 [Pajaroellobacter abortibovis]|uniref:Uncharacterized protein n=1 Tax=Pajaroellobacter abortibovis TaxID=1882918 RepID=A0A1L6MYX9_9BACT|nr:hypothetical protein BCY86_08860 [Pajaroellobacter abortibovis]
MGIALIENTINDQTPVGGGWTRSDEIDICSTRKGKGTVAGAAQADSDFLRMSYDAQACTSTSNCMTVINRHVGVD